MSKKDKKIEATSENKKNLLEIDFSGIDNDKPLSEEELRKKRKLERQKERRKNRTRLAREMSDIYTEAGVRLTIKEARFIEEYVKTGNQRESALKAGYAENGKKASASRYALKLLGKDYIAAEIKARTEKSASQGIADRQEIMQFFSDMMRGKILDQFDMPTTNSDKIKAGIELAKRSIDFEDRLKEKREATRDSAPEIKISLKWEDEDGQEN